MPASELFLRDVIDIKEGVHAGDFKIELSGGFSETDVPAAEFVATDQFQEAFRNTLGLVGTTVRSGQPVDLAARAEKPGRSAPRFLEGVYSGGAVITCRSEPI
ncbi:hypothetical protein [Streptomyces sp. NPDC060065]|uniref:hypothetical protein n=1 Tax=Streptomyces sp. NPDC060065 TaxID=3347050 RepID=UPI0036C68F3E